MPLLPSFLSNFFLNPAGLVAAAALLPLILLYLIRPKPEERVMPSMRFFMEKQDEGKIKRALNRLLTNLILLLHILFILGVAAALAEPFVNDRRPDNAVIVLDRSASMSDDIEEAKKFAKNNMGEKNTLIVAGETVDIPVEQGSPVETRAEIRKVESRDVRTDIHGALQTASDFEGKLVVASDLDQTIDSQSARDLVEELRNQGRAVETMETDDSNHWGIIEVRPRKSNISADIKNFRQKSSEIDISAAGTSKTVKIDGGEVETVTFSASPGKNRIELEKDPNTADNTAYISVPREQKIEVGYIRDDPNPHLEKAIELIEFTELRTYRTPVQGKLDSDIYIIGDASKLLRSTVEKIEPQVKNGAGLVVFSQLGIKDKVDFLPVKDPGPRKNLSVEIQQPERVNVGRTLVHQTKKLRGKSLSDPGHALVKSGYGDGTVIFYNIRDEDFRFNFLYPVFWKKTFEELSNRKTVNDLNLQTGSSLNKTDITTPSGEKLSGSTTLTEAGFYNVSNTVYAANLVDEDESNTESNDVSNSDAEESKSREKVQRFLLAGLAVLALAELGYLAWSGVI